ncbi:MAG: hypothetical protein AAF830_05505 [Pseudomonadota bacterium]
MKLVIGAVAGCLSLAANAFADDDRTALMQKLVGEWDVNLYFSYSAPPSSTKMVISEVDDDGVLRGTFYGTKFDVARARVHEGEVIFTVLTKDGSGLYATSGRLGTDGVVRGQTLAEGRDFIMAWDAEPMK